MIDIDHGAFGRTQIVQYVSMFDGDRGAACARRIGSPHDLNPNSGRIKGDLWRISE